MVSRAINTIRDTNVIKGIIKTHIKSGNVVISINWATHGHGDFGAGSDSTSHIEQLWAHLKSIIKKIYHTILTKNFLLFMRESLLPLNKKWEEITNTFNYVKDLKVTKFYTSEELLEITKKFNLFI